MPSLCLEGQLAQGSCWAGGHLGLSPLRLWSWSPELSQRSAPLMCLLVRSGKPAPLQCVSLPCRWRGHLCPGRLVSRRRELPKGTPSHLQGVLSSTLNVVDGEYAYQAVNMQICQPLLRKTGDPLPLCAQTPWRVGWSEEGSARNREPAVRASGHRGSGEGCTLPCPGALAMAPSSWGPT